MPKTAAAHSLTSAMLRRFKVSLRKEGDRWLIQDFGDPEPRSQRGP